MPTLEAVISWNTERSMSNNMFEGELSYVSADEAAVSRKPFSMKLREIFKSTKQCEECRIKSTHATTNDKTVEDSGDL